MKRQTNYAQCWSKKSRRKKESASHARPKTKQTNKQKPKKVKATSLLVLATIKLPCAEKPDV